MTLMQELGFLRFRLCYSERLKGPADCMDYRGKYPWYPRLGSPQLSTLDPLFTSIYT